MKLPLFTLFLCLALVSFMACDKDDPEPEQPIEIEYPEAPEINTQLQFKQAESIDSVGVYELFYKEKRLFAITHFYGILASDDDGLTWSQKNEGIKQFSVDNGPPIHVYSQYINSSNHRLYAVVSTGIYFSDDNGNTWSGTNYPENGTGGIMGIGVFDDNTLAVSSYNYYRSEDGGENWTFSKRDEIPYMQKFKTVNGDAYSNAYSEYGIMKSTDKGKSWNSIGLLDGTCRDFIVTEDFILASNATGLYIKERDERWKRTNEQGLPEDAVTYIQELEKSGDWIFARAGRSIYISKIINGKISNWQKLELLGLDIFDHYLIKINQIEYVNNRLVIGTLDAEASWSVAPVYGRGIWYADFPLN